MQETPVRFLDLEDPLEESMATHSKILAWRIHMERSLMGYSLPHVAESDTTERLSTEHAEWNKSDREKHSLYDVTYN